MHQVFIEESNIQNQSSKKNESNIMLISQNEINNNENSLKNFEKLFNNKNEEIINTYLVTKEERKLRIKSTFLNKKRANDRNIDILEEKDEEEKNEEENINMNLSKGNNIITKNKGENSLNSSRIKINNSNSKMNKTNNKLSNNSSLMNISMRSLNSIKGDINKIIAENLHLIEEMHKRYKLNYDSNKERQIRQKILEDYYKEKAKRMEKGKLNLLKRKEEFKKMKIREAAKVKYTSTQKKPLILSGTKNEEIHCKPSIKNTNNNNNNKNNLNLSQKENVKQPNIFPKANNFFGTNITFR